MSQNLQEKLAATMKHIYDNNLTTLSGGNISRKGTNNIWITPSGIDKGELTAEDIVNIKEDGSFEGKHRPSSEYPFHLAIYEARPDVHAIIHAHSPTLVTYCVAHKTPDTRITAQTYTICGDIGYSTYVMPASDLLATALAETFTKGHDVVLMENHGVIAVGETLPEAFLRLDTAATVGEISLNAHRLGEIFYMEENMQQAIIGHNNGDEVTHKKIVSFAKRAVKRHMMGRAVGHISARYEDGFLMTPSAGDREFLHAENIIFVNDNQPNQIAALFAAIYEQHPEIEALMFSQPPYATAFAVTHQQINTHSIPEAYLTLLDVPTLPFDIDKISTTLSERSPAMIIENFGVLVTGKTLLQTFDRLEVLEYTARSAIEAQLIGGVEPIAKGAIRDLEESYHRYYKGLSG
jgi:L-fuculose-phosphate aldolase